MTHPATLLWWEQRDTCRRCAHHEVGTLIRPHGDGLGGERCRAAPAERGRREFLYCIDARLEGGPCGLDAKLFVAKVQKRKRK